MTPPSTLDLKDTSNGVLLSVRAQPGARRNAITGVHAGALKIAVAAAPEKGKANDSIIELLCDQLGLSRAQVTIVAGKTTRMKKLLIANVEADELHHRIERCLPESK